MQPIPSTYQMLAYKAFGDNAYADWIQWAVDMLVAGFDTEYLVILAGMSPPYDCFELKNITDKVCNEVGLDYLDKDKVLKNLTSWLVTECLKDDNDYLTALITLKELYLRLSYNSVLRDFYLLYHAKRALSSWGEQSYWLDADSENIDTVIKNYFIKWLGENPLPHVDL